MTSPGPGWLKTDFHLHTAEDPCDAIPYTAAQLVERAVKLGFGTLAITLHRDLFSDPALTRSAAARGLLLIPGVERRIEGADCVVLNISAEEAARLRTFDDLRNLRSRRGPSVFTLAPHPFYVLGGSIGKKLERVLDCFDAIEICHFHTRLLDRNRPARRLAQRTGKPTLATSDAHRLSGFGRHYSWVEAPSDPEAIFDAIRAGRVREVSPSASLPDFLEMLRYVFLEHPVHCFLKRRRTRHA